MSGRERYTAAGFLTPSETRPTENYRGQLMGSNGKLALRRLGSALAFPASADQALRNLESLLKTDEEKKKQHKLCPRFQPPARAAKVAQSVTGAGQEHYCRCLQPIAGDAAATNVNVRECHNCWRRDRLSTFWMGRGGG